MTPLVIPQPDTPEAGRIVADHVVSLRTGFHCWHCGQSHPIDSNEILIYEMLIDAQAFFLQHRHCKPPATLSIPPFSLMKERAQFSNAVAYYSEPDKLTDLFSQISEFRRLDERIVTSHPLYRQKYHGFAHLYTELNNRAEALGFGKYASGGYYRPLYMIEEDRLTDEHIGRGVMLMPSAVTDLTHPDAVPGKLISWDKDGARVEFLRGFKTVNLSDLKWLPDEDN